MFYNAKCMCGGKCVGTLPFLPDGVMVARLTLTQLVKVRVLLGQLTSMRDGVMVARTPLER